MPINMEKNKHMKSAWKSRSHKTEKPWGHEIIWSGHSSIHGKILHIKMGHRTSLKYNPLKTESLYWLSGTAMVTYGSEHSLADPVVAPVSVEQFGPGDCLMVQSACPYRIEALEDCEIIEIGNHMSDVPVRIEDDYERVDKGIE